MLIFRKAMITAIDDSVGRIVQKLKESGFSNYFSLFVMDYRLASSEWLFSG